MAPLPAVTKAGIDILFPSQYLALLDKARDDRFFDTLVILFHTGMRYSELSQIDSEHYDKRSGKIRIESTKQKCKNPNRWIPLTPAALVSVERWIREGFSPMATQSFNERIGKICRPMGFRVSTKTSRKTNESWRLLLGDDYLKVCTNIGHTPETAYHHYVQELPFISADIESIKQIFGRI